MVPDVDAVRVVEAVNDAVCDADSVPVAVDVREPDCDGVEYADGDTLGV